MTNHHQTAGKKERKEYKKLMKNHHSALYRKTKKMGLKIFQKKGEILEYLGEDKKNVRVIDRMIVKGEIVRGDDGEYILAKDILKEAFILLQITQREVSSRSDEIEKLRKELKAAKESVERRESDLEFQVEENEKKEDKIKKLQAMIDGIQDGANHRNAYMGD